MVSKSGVSTVPSYSLSNGGAMIFLPKNSIMNIQTLSPAFDVIHTLIALIELYKNYMKFPHNPCTYYSLTGKTHSTNSLSKDFKTHLPE